jgi:hypothetical protein
MFFLEEYLTEVLGLEAITVQEMGFALVFKSNSKLSRFLQLH